jgi:recombination protein RecT
MSENMMTKPAQSKNDLAAVVNSDAMTLQWQIVLPKCLTPERLARVAVTQLRKNPKLAACNQGSFLTAMMTCAELGIEPNGRHAHLIPYGQECQLIIDYKGLVELAIRSGKISRIHADVVCENDTISIKNGIISHEINPLKDRGEMVGAYAICAFVDGTEKHEYMSKTEIESVRKRSRAGQSGPWVTDFNEMAKKTVFRRMSKWLPLSPEVLDSAEKEADAIAEKMVYGTVAPVTYEAPAVAVQAEHDEEITNTVVDGEAKPVNNANKEEKI